MKIEFTHDIIAKIVSQRVPAIDKRLKDIQNSIDQRFQAYQDGIGDLLGLKDIAAIEDYLDDLMLSDEKMEFVEKSRAAIRAIQEKDQRSNRRLRLYLGLAFLSFLVAAGLGSWASIAGREARDARNQADEALRTIAFERAESNFLYQQDAHEAQRRLQQFLNLDNAASDTVNYYKALRYLADAYYQDPDSLIALESIRTFSDSLQQVEFQPYFISRRGDIYLDKLKDTLRAEQDYIQAVRIAKSPIGIDIPEGDEIFYMPWHLLKMKSFYDSTSLVQKLPATIQSLVDENPENPANVLHFELLAGHYEEMDSTDLAEKALKQALELSKGELTAYYTQKIENLNLSAQKNEEITRERITTTTLSNNRIAFSNNISSNVEFTKYRQGYFTVGKQTIEEFLDNNETLVQDLQLSESSIRVLKALAQTNPHLDAVNTWDNNVLTFGIFPWKLNPHRIPGNLPILLGKIQEQYPDIYEKYFGQYQIGLDLNPKLNNGFLTLKGKRINNRATKEQFRSTYWAFRFWTAGQDPLVQAVQIDHAYNTLNLFYTNEFGIDRYQIKGYNINQILSSEYGVALILDNRLDRPGYIQGSLEKAFEESGLHTPESWETEEELKFIEAYVKIRAVYGKTPMTKANERAEVFKKLAEAGELSTERGSFQK